jgi:endonuclease-3 related protein
MDHFLPLLPHYLNPFCPIEKSPFLMVVLKNVSLGFILQEIFQRLFEHFGPQGWWPAETPFEVFVGAILTQNTAWKNVQKAIENLKAQGALDPFVIASLSEEKLQELVRPAGFFKQKAKRLKEASLFLIREFSGSIDRMKELPLEELRPKLLSINGIGPETCDSILLYACDKAIFVVDAYTKRVLSRHGLAEEKSDYHRLQRLFMETLPHDVELFKEYHALLVALGKNYCRPIPKCEMCPLKGIAKDEGSYRQEGEKACG